MPRKKNPVTYDLTGLSEDMFKRRALRTYRQDRKATTEERQKAKAQKKGQPVIPRPRKQRIERWLPSVDLFIESINIDYEAASQRPRFDLFETVEGVEEQVDEIVNRVLRTPHTKPRILLLLGEDEMVSVTEQLTPLMMLHDLFEAWSLVNDTEVRGPNDIFPMVPRWPAYNRTAMTTIFLADQEERYRGALGEDVLTSPQDKVSDLFAQWAKNEHLTEDDIWWFDDPIVQQWFQSLRSLGTSDWELQMAEKLLNSNLLKNKAKTLKRVNQFFTEVLNDMKGNWYSASLA